MISRKALGNLVRETGKSVVVDLPYIIDSALRRIDFRANRLWAQDGTDEPGVGRALPQGSVLLCALIVFILYGMTPDALCSVFRPPLDRVGLALVGIACVVAALFVLFWLAPKASQYRDKRLPKASGQVIRRRALAIWLTSLVLIPVFGLASLGLLAKDLFFDPTTCANSVFRWDSLGQMVLAVGLSVACVIALRRFPQHARRIHSSGLLAAVLLLWLLLSSSDSQELNNQPYVTIMSVLVVPFIALAYLSSKWAEWIMRDLPQPEGASFHTMLCKTDLFEKRDEPTMNWQRLFYAALAPILQHPLFLLLLPSFASIIAPVGKAGTWFLWGLFLSYLFVFQGSLTERWNQMLLLVRRLFITGLPLVLSVAVIVLGLLRVKDVQYVSIVLDAAPFGAITMSILSLYVLFWLFELAINRPIIVHLLALLGPTGNREQAVQDGTMRNAYPIVPGCVGTDVKASERFIQIHGTGRFAVVGRTSKQPSETAFHSYNKSALFGRLLAEGETVDPDHHKERAIAWAELHRRIRAYFFAINVAVALLVLPGWWWISGSNLPPFVRRPLMEIPAQTPVARPGYDLRGALIEKAKTGRPAIVFAASGGGTRAALYATSVLRGLAQLGVADDIVLLSGVSGGSAAVAYFAANRDRLLPPPGSNELDPIWNTYVDRMTYPYIEDVIEGSAAIRVIAWDTYSHLLAESMERNLGVGDGTTLDSLTSVGLILNATVAGHPAGDSELMRRLMPDDAPSRAYAVSRGGRMVFGNLSSYAGFPGNGSYREAFATAAVRFHVHSIDRQGISLTKAIAASANFPAVFPNTGIWINRDKPANAVDKYYVTDGGATENRGLFETLYLLRHAVAGLKRAQLPEIHIISAEASSMSFDYTRDRGLGTALSAGPRIQLADGLIREVIGHICREIPGGATGAHWEKDRTGCATKLQVHFLNMPTVFRARNGFGTHWMMPGQVHLADPGALTKGGADKHKLSCSALIDVVLAMHAVPFDYCAADGPIATHTTLRQWMCADARADRDPHWQTWDNLVTQFGGKPPVSALTLPADRVAWRNCGGK